MGKRELVIIAAFIAVGVVAYQLTAPRSTQGSRGLSFSTLMDNVRREVRGNRAAASVRSNGTVGDVGDVTEVRVSSVSEVTVSGESRTDVGYELVVDATGPDEKTAREAAGRASLAIDRVGASLRLRVTSARGARQTARLVLTVPARFAVYVDGAGSNTRVRAERTAAVHFESVVGDSTATAIAGAVTGSHRNGTLAISDAGEVTMSLVSSRLSLAGVRGPVSLTARGGRADISGTPGPIEIDGTNQESTIDHPRKAVRVGGTGGRVRVLTPEDRVSIDVRRTSVDVTLDRAVAITATTTEAPLQIWLRNEPPIAVDAVATDGGVVDASAFGLTAIALDQESRLRHAFGGGSAAIALRNQRGNIVIAAAK
jgi:hypothetical protein